jgi:hypothetical protein
VSVSLTLRSHTLLAVIALLQTWTIGHCDAAIVKPKAPDGGRQIVYENVRKFLRTDPRFLGGLHIEDLTIADPYRDYVVGLNDLVSGHLLSAAKLGQWHYLLIHGTDAVGAVELNADEKQGKALDFDGFFQTNFSVETLKALRKAKKLPQINAHDYELRRLDIPAVSFVAVWLHGETDDIIIPLPPTFGRLNAYQLCSENQIIQALKPDAEKTLKSGKMCD